MADLIDNGKLMLPQTRQMFCRFMVSRVRNIKYECGVKGALHLTLSLAGSKTLDVLFCQSSSIIQHS